MDKPTEQTDAQTTETEPKETEPKETAAASTERKVPESALTKQAVDFNAQIAKMQKQINAHESEKVKAKEAKMKADGDLQKLLDDRDSTIKQMQDDAKSSARSLLESSAREQLRNLGMSDPLYLQGAIAGLPADATSDTVPEWAKIMKADNEAAFTAPATPVGQASLPGGPAVNGSDTASLEARLQSDDPKVKAAAYSEQLRNELSGKS